MVERGTLFAVCCTAEIPADLMNDILDSTYTFSQPPDPRLVVIDSLDKTFTSASTTPLRTTASSSSFPAVFQGQSPEACAAAVKSLVARTGSNINFECFAVLDDRTLRDHTVLLCQADDDEGTVESLRAEAQIIDSKMKTWSIGHSDPGEDREIAERDEGNVLRMRRPTPRGPAPEGEEGQML